VRPVMPPDNLPEHVDAARFDPPESIANEVDSIAGIIHKDPEDKEPVALEFMFELSEQDIKVLKHDPYLTITILADHLHPFRIETSHQYTPDYEQLEEHHHICAENVTHDTNEWWRCDNPRHDKIKDRNRVCDSCWDAVQESLREHGKTDN
jgi:hypothetical protein